MAEADRFSVILSSLDSVVSQLAAPKSLDEAEKALAAAKTTFEIRKLDAERRKAEQDALKSDIDRRIAPRQLRYTFLGVVFGALVPLASVLGVLYNAREQTRITLEQSHEKAIADNDARWRAFEDKLDSATSPIALYASPTFVARLREFSRDPQREEDLREISKRLLTGLVTSYSAFQAIWSLQFEKVTAKTFATALELAKVARVRYDEILADCKLVKLDKPLTGDPIWTGYFGVCSPRTTIDEITSVVDKAQMQNVVRLRNDINGTDAVKYFLSTQITQYLRDTYPTTEGAAELDLSGVAFNSSNLDGVNFGKANLRQAIFDQTSLKGANLDTDSLTYDFRAATWWDAAAINQTVLQWLVGNAYPNAPGQALAQKYKITFEEYQADIARLCTSHAAACRSQCLRFGPDAPAAPPGCS